VSGTRRPTGNERFYICQEVEQRKAMNEVDVLNYLGGFWTRFAAVAAISASALIVANTVLGRLHPDQKRECANCKRLRRGLKPSADGELLCRDCRGPGPVTLLAFALAVLGLSGWIALTWLWALPSMILLWWFFLLGLYFWFREWKASKLDEQPEDSSQQDWEWR
jgi:fatty acid desaturase